MHGLNEAMPDPPSQLVNRDVRLPFGGWEKASVGRDVPGPDSVYDAAGRKRTAESNGMRIRAGRTIRNV